MSNNNANSSLYSKAIATNDLADNGATVLMGGDIDSSKTVTNAPNASILGVGPGVYNKPVESAHNGTTKTLPAGDFAYQLAGSYIVKGGNITTALAGVAYTGLLNSANSIQQRSINSRLTRNTVLIDSWDYTTGTPTFNVDNPSSDDFDINSEYIDPSRAVPGNLVIIDNGSIPTVVAYRAKTG